MLSAIECVSEEFKEKCKIKNVLINKFTGPKESKISVQCLEKNMDLHHKRRRLFELYKKHGVHYILCPWDINVDISEIISIKMV